MVCELRNFQIYKLDLEKEEEPEIKLLMFLGSEKKQRNLYIYKFRFVVYTKGIDSVDHNKL